MNKTVTEATALVESLDRDLGTQTDVDVVVCPPFTALGAVSAKLKNSLIKVGANTHYNDPCTHETSKSCKKNSVRFK